MAKNITYLLGAGASANCLPVINELPTRLKLFRDNLVIRVQEESNIQLISPSKFSKITTNSIGRLIIPEIDWLLEEMENHNTVDTLAKKFYLIRNEHQNLERLKKILVTYFLYEQSFRHGDIREGIKKELPDKRYDSLIATIISKKIDIADLPSNFKIVTWNYDIQFELAYKNYLPKFGLEQIQEKLQSIPTEKYLQGQSIDLARFSIVKLNGMAQSIKANLYVGKILGDGAEWDEKFTSFLENICSFYNSLNHETLKLFTYSWEDPTEYIDTLINKGEMINIAKSIFKETEILVIIGYSFPLFNRSIDKELFLDCPKLRSIYIQDFNADNIKSLMQSSFPVFNRKMEFVNDDLEYTEGMQIKTAIITDVSQFFIPPEADI
ncbi:MAG: hypothetical protein V4557_14775 [Bacteroidota bacterium]